MEDWKWGGLDRLSEQAKLAEGFSQKRRLQKPAESSCPIEGIDDDVCYALASITPLLGVTETCLEQSLVYLEELFSDAKSEDDWAKKSIHINCYILIFVT